MLLPPGRSVMQCGEKSAMLCGAGAGPRWGRGKLRNCFKLLLLQGESGGGGGSSGRAAAVSAGATAKIAIFGHWTSGK